MIDSIVRTCIYLLSSRINCGKILAYEKNRMGAHRLDVQHSVEGLQQMMHIHKLQKSAKHDFQMIYLAETVPLVSDS